MDIMDVLAEIDCWILTKSDSAIGLDHRTLVSAGPWRRQIASEKFIFKVLDKRTKVVRARRQFRDPIGRQGSDPRTQRFRKQLELGIDLELYIALNINLKVHRQRHVEGAPGADVIDLVAGVGAAFHILHLQPFDVEEVPVKSSLGLLDGLARSRIVHSPVQRQCVVPVGAGE
ncbi:hypothetical protein D3C87_1684980 [compost metagenome]